MRMKKKKGKWMTLLGLLLLLAAILMILLLKREKEADEKGYSSKQVSVAEVSEELCFGIYAEENWKDFFSIFHKEHLTGGMLMQLLERLGVDDYVKVSAQNERRAVTREEWNLVYEQILDYLDMEEEVQKEQILVLDMMQAEGGTVIITNRGDYYTALPASYFEKWNAYEIYRRKEQCLGILGISQEEAVISNAYLKESREDGITFLYGGTQYEKEIEAQDELVMTGVCDFVFVNGGIQTVRMKKDSIEGNLLSYDEDTIEIEGYGKINHAGKIPVYQTYGEVTETSISNVVLGNMKVEYVTGENQICAILITRPAEIEDIRVLLLAEDGGNFRSELYLKCTTPFMVKCGAREETVDADTVVSAADYLPAGAQDTLTVTPEGEGQMIVCDAAGTALSNGYDGSMEIRLYEEGYTLVNQLPFETYLCAVVPSEMPSSYASQALCAQAVCARSYAYRQLLRADLAQYGAHINDSTSYQVYNKIAPTKQSIAAVYDTAGKILTYRGEPVEAYYYSTSMGYTDTAEVWNAENMEHYGYLKSVSLLETPYDGNLADEASFYEYITKPAVGYDSNMKYFRWIGKADYHEKTGEINQILESRRAASPRNILYYEADGVTETDSIGQMGDLLEISVAQRSGAGSILALKLRYETGMVIVKTEYNIRKVLGCGVQEMVYQDGSRNENVTMLPSAVCALTPQEDGTVLLQGGGYGHGLGMSQNAANGMAQAGMNYEEILQYFYQDIKIEQMTE